jgi:hypothetical protein
LGLRLCFKLDDFEVSIGGREPVETFPPWRMAVDLVTSEVPRAARFDGPALLEELRALARADLDDEARLYVEDGQLFVELLVRGALEARTSIPAEGRMDVSAVQPAYLRDVLAQAEGAVSIARGLGSNQPLLFHLGAGRHALVMALAV